MLSQIGLAYKVEDHFLWVSRTDVLMREPSEELETYTYMLDKLDRDTRNDILAKVTEVTPKVTEQDSGEVSSSLDVHLFQKKDSDSTGIVLTAHNTPSNIEKVRQIIKRFTAGPESNSDEAAAADADAENK